jgi:hypothetical protein
MARYGKPVFPPPPPARPWIYANFVQRLDGIVSVVVDASGSGIGGSAKTAGSIRGGMARRVSVLVAIYFW